MDDFSKSHIDALNILNEMNSGLGSEALTNQKIIASLVTFATTLETIIEESSQASTNLQTLFTVIEAIKDIVSSMKEAMGQDSDIASLVKNIKDLAIKVEESNLGRKQEITAIIHLKSEIEKLFDRDLSFSAPVESAPIQKSVGVSSTLKTAVITSAISLAGFYLLLKFLY